MFYWIKETINMSVSKIFNESNDTKFVFNQKKQLHLHWCYQLLDILIRVPFSFTRGSIKKISNNIPRIFSLPNFPAIFLHWLSWISDSESPLYPNIAFWDNSQFSFTREIVTSNYPVLPQVCLKKLGTSQTKSSNSSGNEQTLCDNNMQLTEFN